MDKTYIIATLERKHDALAESHARLMEALESSVKLLERNYGESNATLIEAHVALDTAPKL